jgi:hypothetical protein
VLKLTQLNGEKMAMILQGKILKQVEVEAKGRNFALEPFMELASVYVMSDLGSFVELERLYNFRKTLAKKDHEFDREKVKEYIRESLLISESILNGELDQNCVFVFPHLLSDKLYNCTGYESEEVVLYIRKMILENSVDPELVDLIVKEAYSVEKSKEICFSTFDNQMMEMDKMAYEAYKYQNSGHANTDPLEDPSIKKMIEMGLLSKEDALKMVKQHGLPPPGMFTPGMMGPGLMPPGMFPMGPGMMPPGMLPGMLPMGPGMMPPGMLGPGMMPPGMLGPGMMPPGQIHQHQQKPPVSEIKKL